MNKTQPFSRCHATAMSCAAAPALERRRAPSSVRGMARAACATLLCSLLIAACGGGGGGGTDGGGGSGSGDSGSGGSGSGSGGSSPQPPQAQTYTVGGSVSGLTGSGLTLQLNGSNSLSVSANGSFTFPSGLAAGTAYTVTIGTQPAGPNQFCVLSGGTGSIAAANVSTVTLACQDSAQFAYVAAATSATGGSYIVAAYAVDSSSGVLTALPASPYAISYSPGRATSNPGGTFLYVPTLLDTRTDGTITAFAINATTGALTPVSGSPFVINVAPGVLLIEPKGRFAYAPSFDSGAVAAFALDATTGAPTALTGSPFAACAEYSAPAAVIDPAGTHLYVGGSGPVPAGDPLDGLICAYTIDASSGALTPVAGSPFHASNDPGNALAIDPSGKFLFLAGTGGLAEFLVNADGTLTAVAGSPFAAGENPELLALDPAGPFIYVGNQSTGSYAQIFGFSIDATTGSLTPVPGSPYANGDVPLSLTFDPSGSRIYVGNQSSNTFTTYTVDPQTGALSAAGAPAATGAGSIVLVQ